MTWAELPPALIFLAGAVILPLVPRRLRAWAFLAFPAAAFLQLTLLETGTTVGFPFLDYELMPLRVDGLSLAFGYAFALIAFLGGLYALHLRDTGQQVSSLLYAGSGLGVVFAGDLFTVLVFWEIMAVTSAYLVWARGTSRSYRSAMRYFFVHLVGGAVLMAGVLWHLGETGSLAFVAMEGGAAAWLILAAFAINAAIVPLHAWLPDAYPRATVTGAIFMSAFTTKTAVYALARGFPGWEVLVVAGVAMALYGVYYAVVESDIRGILSYHIISQVGYMVAAVGIGTELAISGATAHAFNNILYKSLLFMGAGAVLYATGKSRLTELGGLASALPYTLGFYMVGAFAITGFPLFAGFVSKPVVIHTAELAGQDLGVLLLHLTSVGTFLSVGLKLPYFTWFNGEKKPQDLEVSRRVPWGMLAAMGLTAAATVAIGVKPSLLYDVMPHPVDYEPYTASHLIKTVQLFGFTFLGFWILKSRLEGKAGLVLDTDWFYRRPADLAYRACVVAVERVFAESDRRSIEAFRAMARFAVDPWGHVRRFAEDPGASLGQTLRALRAWASRGPLGADPEPAPTVFDVSPPPTPAEGTLGAATLFLMLCFVAVVLVTLLA